MNEYDKMILWLLGGVAVLWIICIGVLIYDCLNIDKDDK